MTPELLVFTILYAAGAVVTGKMFYFADLESVTAGKGVAPWGWWHFMIIALWPFLAVAVVPVRSDPTEETWR